ncbi:glycosyl transferase [Bacillus sp. Leaf406]|nr:glycosyl transferase [Bacillus sp. Leaf406]
MQPLVSIIIPFYNCAFVDQAIESALQQSYPNIEVILVDDGSDREVGRIHPYLSSINYVRKANGGTASAINTGIHHSNGEYIAWLSSDDVFLPHKVEKQIHFMKKHHAKASFTNYDYIGPDNNLLIPKCGEQFQHAEGVYRSFLTSNPINGCTVILHREVFDRVGYFSTEFNYTQDYEMWYRILLKGIPFYYLDQVLLNYRAHPNQGTSKNQEGIKKETFMIKHHYIPRLENFLNFQGNRLKRVVFE